MHTQLRDQVTRTLRGAGVVAWVGFGIGAAYLGFVMLILAGETLTDPGGRTGAGLTLAWLVPALALAALALLRPTVAVPLLAILTLLPVGMGFWTLVDYQGARAWEDSHGPIGLVVLLVVAVGLVVLGLARPMPAGVLLLVATVAPAFLAMIGAGQNWFQALTISLVTAPLVAVGVIYVVAGIGRSRSMGTGPAAPLSLRSGSPAA